MPSSLATRRLELHQAALEQLRDGNYAEALVVLRRLLLLLPVEAEVRADLLTIIAFAATESGRTDDALTSATQAVALAPGNLLARRELLRAKRRVGHGVGG